MYEVHQGQKGDTVAIYIFVSILHHANKKRRASSILIYDFEKVWSCGLVKSPGECQSQVGASQLQREGRR